MNDIQKAIKEYKPVLGHILLKHGSATKSLLALVYNFKNIRKEIGPRISLKIIFFIFGWVLF